MCAYLDWCVDSLLVSSHGPLLPSCHQRMGSVVRKCLSILMLVVCEGEEQLPPRMPILNYCHYCLLLLLLLGCFRWRQGPAGELSLCVEWNGTQTSSMMFRVILHERRRAGSKGGGLAERGRLETVALLLLLFLRPPVFSPPSPRRHQ